MARVKINQGILEGELVENDYGGSFYSFKGIPYAEPPIGDLRFKPPIPPKGWEGIRCAKKFGPKSYQINITGQIEGSEDCLYLNVYTPDIKPVKLLPVMVWIHGGSFVVGSGNDDMFGPEFLVRHGVILVTLNYRLGALGFLCLDTEEIPGNAGMKDQVAALRWVKNNIRNFGGDPDQITLFGQSAGAVSVGYQLISPMSKGLFKRAILQSGSSTCWWAQIYEPRQRALCLAKQLGFYSENNLELYEFFKTVPLSSLIKKELPITISENDRGEPQVYFSVVSEKKFSNNERFFYGDPYEALHNKIHEGVEVMTGYTEDDGVFWLRNCDVEKIYRSLNKLLDFMVPKPIIFNCLLKDQLTAGERLKKFYFGNEIVSKQHLFKFIKYLTVCVIAYGVIQFAKILAYSTKNKVYLYRFSCKSERNFATFLFGINNLIDNKVVACHGDDLPYIFNGKLIPKVNQASETFRLINNATKLWTNFVKYGYSNPTPDDTLGVRWRPFDIEKQEYLDISNQLKVSTEPDKEDIEFWEEIFRQYYPGYVYAPS